MKYNYKKIKTEIEDFEFKTKEYPKNIRDYFNFYKLNVNNYNHYFGYIDYDQYKIATHVFYNEKNNKNIIIVHGYLVHTGYLSNLIKELGEKNYNIICFDLPGHGLSTGEISGIDNFKDYGGVIDKILNENISNMKGKYYAIAHSTGCSGFYEYMNSYNTVKIEKYIFLSPLIHSNMWNISKFVYKVFGKHIKKYPRIFRKSSSDKKYLRFQKKNDPIQIRYLPISWSRALFDWNKNLESYQMQNENLVILQGLKDDIVDYKYNIKFLKSKIKKIKIHNIKDARHDLINEIKPIREKVFEIIINELENEEESYGK